MEPSPGRRSDRIVIELPLEIFGDDANLFAFTEKTRTAVVTRHGAKIYSKRKLGRDQEIVIRCLSTGKEGDARIVGELGESADGYAYGVEFLKPEVNVWGIEFPPLSQAEQAAGRTLLECIRCRGRELVYLDTVEVEVLDTGQGISRLCKRCTDLMLWKVVREGSGAGPTPSPSEPRVAQPVPAATSTPRETRPGATAALRHPILGDEIVTAEKISAAGLTVRSIRRYRLATIVEIAVPYTKGGANVFAAARITTVVEGPDGKVRMYDLEYVTPGEAWPRQE